MKSSPSSTLTKKANGCCFLKFEMATGGGGLKREYGARCAPTRLRRAKRSTNFSQVLLLSIGEGHQEGLLVLRSALDCPNHPLWCLYSPARHHLTSQWVRDRLLRLAC